MDITCGGSAAPVSWMLTNRWWLDTICSDYCQCEKSAFWTSAVPFDYYFLRICAQQQTANFLLKLLHSLTYISPTVLQCITIRPQDGITSSNMLDTPPVFLMTLPYPYAISKLLLVFLFCIACEWIPNAVITLLTVRPSCRYHYLLLPPTSYFSCISTLLYSFW